MAEFLRINNRFTELSRLIRESKKFLFLVSPYIAFTDKQLNELEYASRRGVRITIVFRYFGSSEDERKRSPFIDDVFELPGIEVVACPDLHAKIYVNETTAIISSRNLTTRDEGSSIEVGFRFGKASDSSFYSDLLDAAREIAGFRECQTIVDNTNERRKRRIMAFRYGFCIRCRARIPFNPDRPYCPECHFEWSNFERGDSSIEEKYCHRCGMRTRGINRLHSQDTECSY